MLGMDITNEIYEANLVPTSTSIGTTSNPGPEQNSVKIENNNNVGENSTDRTYATEIIQPVEQIDRWHSTVDWRFCRLFISVSTNCPVIASVLCISLYALQVNFLIGVFFVNFIDDLFSIIVGATCRSREMSEIKPTKNTLIKKLTCSA